MLPHLRVCDTRKYSGENAGIGLVAQIMRYDLGFLQNYKINTFGSFSDYFVWVINCIAMKLDRARLNVNEWHGDLHCAAAW